MNILGKSFKLSPKAIRDDLPDGDGMALLVVICRTISEGSPVAMTDSECVKAVLELIDAGLLDVIVTGTAEGIDIVTELKQPGKGVVSRFGPTTVLFAGRMQ